MINFDRIEENIFIGSAPQSDVDVGRLVQMKVTTVVSLQSDQDLTGFRIDWKKLQSSYQYNNIAIHRFPIIDFDEIDLGNRLAEPIQALNQLLSVGHRVYLHCNAGICRAPATVLGYFCHYRSMSIEEGLKYIRSNRPQVHPYLTSVEQALTNLKSSESQH